MLRLAFLACLAACGGAPSSTKKPDPPPAEPEEPPLTELQTRQNAACEQVGPRLTQCAVADAKATMTPEQLAKLDLERTAPINTREFIKKCRAATMSSRQVRVYEVCLREETECDPFIACLDNAKPQR